MTGALQPDEGHRGRVTGTIPPGEGRDEHVAHGSHPSRAQLRPIDLFDGLGDEQLELWAQAALLRTLAPGDLISEQDEPVHRVHLVLEGSLAAFAVDAQGAVEPLGEHVAPTWVGAIGALTGGVSLVRMQASTLTIVAWIEPERFIELTLAHRSVFERVMAQVRPVTGRIAAFEQNRERLASLGTMSAGLAHELNNPAAAALRASTDLAAVLDVLSSTIGYFVKAGVERAEAAQLVELHDQALAQHASRPVDDALAAADAEEELLTALEDMDIPEAWLLSESLASAGVDRAWLTRVGELAGSATPAALRWVAASITARGLASELSESTRRMSDLVAAVKAYSHLDRGELVEVDVHEGLETTLTVLGHKLKHTRIAVVRAYDSSLPKLTVRGGELNQVWTNLLDNAIDALGESGTITIATSLDGGCVRVDIGDDGPGIDPTVRERIFDPFFTTKEVGQGTGLGLDTARRIVVGRHRGSIEVQSEPGRTVFNVWLPLQPAQLPLQPASHRPQGEPAA